MEIPNLIGQKLDEGLTTLKKDYGLLKVAINEYNIPDDFYKKNVSSGVKRIVRQRITFSGDLELAVFTFNEIPDSLL